MACPCNFEPAIQVNCILDIVKIVRSGELISKKGEILEHAGCVVGSLGAYVGNESESVFGDTVTVPVPATIEECCDQLEAQLQLTQAGARKLDPATWALILQLVRMALKLL